MSELYKAIAGSPITYLASDVSAGQTTIAVADDSVLPDAPNICTIGYGENIETIRYGAKSNGVLQNVTRGIEGTPRAWPAGTEVARFFTAYDHNSSVQQFNQINSKLQYFQPPTSVPYDSGDDAWKTITGIHFYYIGGDGTGRGYPTDYAMLVHMKTDGGTLVFQQCWGHSGNLWYRRVPGSTSMADAEWVKFIHPSDIAPQDISSSFTRVVGTGGSHFARYIPYLNMVWLSFNITGVSEDTSSSTTIITFDTKYAPVSTIRGVVRSPSTSGLGNGQISIGSGSISVTMDSNENTLRGVYTWFTA